MDREGRLWAGFMESGEIKVIQCLKYKKIILIQKKINCNVRVGNMILSSVNINVNI